MADYSWFVIVDGQKQGPYSKAQLKGLKNLTPDTMAWREGMEKWLPLRDIPELKDLFEEEDPSLVDEITNEAISSSDLALTLPNADPPLWFWLLFLATLIIYALIQIYYS